MKNWDKILKDFSHKCKGGAPDLKNSTHLQFLRESLILEADLKQIHISGIIVQAIASLRSAH